MCIVRGQPAIARELRHESPVAVSATFSVSACVNHFRVDTVSLQSRKSRLKWPHRARGPAPSPHFQTPIKFPYGLANRLIFPTWLTFLWSSRLAARPSLVVQLYVYCDTLLFACALTRAGQGWYLPEAAHPYYGEVFTSIYPRPSPPIPTTHQRKTSTNTPLSSA